MTEVAVLDTGSEDIAGKIASRINEYGGNTGDILIRSVRSMKEITGRKPDILVLPADTAQDCGGSSLGEQVRVGCGILLLPGDSAAVASGGDIFDAGCI
ncbi:MAG: hypothetical protein GX847_11105, partial [Clostridiales bacterium]|nr:hypothetical protein [Clostridiales bacterium]